MKNTALDAKWLPWLLLAVALIFVWQLHAILAPFVIGALIAYMGDPVVDRLEARGFSRSSGVAIVFVALLGFLTVVLSVVLPLLVKQLAELVQSVPDAYRWVSETAIPWVQARLSLSPVALPSIDWESGMANHWQSLGAATGNVLKQLTTSGLSLVGTVLNLALIPVVAFYLMRDWDIMMAALLRLVPRSWEATVSESVVEAHGVLGSFVRGQLVVMLAQAVMYSLGLWAVGLNYALVLGLTAGLVSIIPYAGSIIGVGSAMIVAYFQFGLDPSALALVAMVFVIGQLVESFLLTPVLLGDQIGLHPVAVIFALMAGGQLAGFTGVLLALPVAAVLLVFLKRVLGAYLETDVYNAGD